MANEDLMTLLERLQGGSQGLLPTFLDGAATKGTQAHSSIGSVAARTIGSGLTLLPAITGLLRLFGVGGKKEEPPPLEKFELPPSIQTEIGLSRSGDSFLIDRGAGDRIRQASTLPAASVPSNGTAAAAPAGSSITVNVQAMDSQSFLDRREDIARAVREAMLESHSLNDVVSEL